MTGENFIRMGGRTDIKSIKEKILSLKEEAGKIERNYDDFDEEAHDKLCKQIEWQEYLLWGLTEK
jgi:FtsZ-binding cell division protein ZapB